VSTVPQDRFLIYKTKYTNLFVSVLGLFSIIILGALYFRVADNDLFARLATGRLIFESSQIPLQDPFAYSLTKDLWIDHEWLSAVFFYWTYHNSGDFGLFCLNLGIGLATLFFLRAAQRELGSDSQIQVLLLFLVLWPSSFIWNSTVRSQVFTFLLFAVELFILARIKISGRYSFALFLIPIITLWANFHGGFVVGLGFLILAAFGLGVSNWRLGIFLVLIAGISLLTILFLNPYGLSYYGFIIEAVTKTRLEITEWGMTKVSAANGIFYSICLAVLLLLISKYRIYLGLEAVLFLLVSMFFGIKHQRHVPFFLFTAAIYLPGAVSYYINASGSWFSRRIVALSNVVAFVLPVGILVESILLVNVGINWRTFSLDYSQYPVEAMDWLKANSQGGKVLVHFNEGSYVLWKGYPNFKVSIDGRYEEVYPDSTFEKALAALNPSSPKFRESFLELSPDFVILCQSTTPFEVAKSFPGSWKMIFEEDSKNCAVFGMF
jgi:hypothetical protein